VLHDFGGQVQPPAAVAAPSVPSIAGQSSAPIQSVGEIVAMSPDSLTTRTSDGRTTTFRLTPQTAQIAASTENAGGAVIFDVNDAVTVVGTVQGGVPVATAVAHTGAGQGAPMDYGLPT